MSAFDPLRTLTGGRRRRFEEGRTLEAHGVDALKNEDVRHLIKIWCCVEGNRARLPMAGPFLERPMEPPMKIQRRQNTIVQCLSKDPNCLLAGVWRLNGHVWPELRLDQCPGTIS